MLALKVHKDLYVSVLRLNANKAEFIVFNNKAQCEPLTSHSSLSIRGNPLHPAVLKTCVVRCTCLFCINWLCQWTKDHYSTGLCIIELNPIK